MLNHAKAGASPPALCVNYFASPHFLLCEAEHLPRRITSPGFMRSLPLRPPALPTLAIWRPDPPLSVCSLFIVPIGVDPEPRHRGDQPSWVCRLVHHHAEHRPLVFVRHCMPQTRSGGDDVGN